MARSNGIQEVVIVKGNNCDEIDEGIYKYEAKNNCKYDLVNCEFIPGQEKFACFFKIKA